MQKARTARPIRELAERLAKGAMLVCQLFAPSKDLKMCTIELSFQCCRFRGSVRVQLGVLAAFCFASKSWLQIHHGQALA